MEEQKVEATQREAGHRPRIQSEIAMAAIILFIVALEVALFTFLLRLLR